MPQGKIKKGFFFYFGLFVLLLIAIFLIILVILMFNPGKTILWFQYFTAGDSYVITETTDTSQGIDLSSSSNITNIEVECSYADVRIQKSNEVRQDAIIIENNAKGFALASDAREFSYSVTLSGNTLNIEVIEPTGFIYISDDITITINIFFNEDYGTSSGDFSNFGFNISTTSGNVDIGASTNNNQTISPRAITAETTSGSIIFRSCTQIDTIQSLSLTTDNGGIQTIGNNVTYNGEEASGFVLNSGTINLRTTRGTIDLDVVKINEGGTLEILNDRGNVVIDNIEVDNINVNCYEGNYLLGDIICNEFSFTPSEDRIASPNIQIESLTGTFIISSRSTDYIANPDITIQKLTGSANIQNISGSININELDGYAYAIVQNGSINISYASQSSYTNDNNITATGNASVTVNFLGEFINSLRVITENGNINFNVKNNTAFVANSFVNDGTNYGETGEVPAFLDDSKISTNIGTEDKNPLIIGDGSRGTINIYTNGNVSFNLV